MKDYKNGMVAGAKPFEEVYQKQEAALRRVAENFGNNVSRIHEVTNSLIDDMDGIKRKELYDLNAPSVDLKSFNREEKEYLAAGLYTLAAQCKSSNPSPFQKAFARSIQGYIDVKTPQTAIDLSKIDSIDSGKKQKAIMQVFMEYLFLEKEDFSFLDEYPDAFKSFSVNEVDREAILQVIRTIHNAVDSLGFIEKYGFVPEDSDEETAAIGIAAPVELEKLTIDHIFHIPAGETKEFKAKEIRLEADIHCEGSLVFDRCVIYYNGDDIKGQIRFGNDTSISFTHCTIIGVNNTQRTEGISSNNIKYLIDGRGSSYKRHPVLTIGDSELVDCICFLQAVEVRLSNSRIRYSKVLPEEHRFSSNVQDNSTIENCTIECGEITKDPDRKYYFALIDDFSTISGCTFKNVSGCINPRETANIKNCEFYSCWKAVSNMIGRGRQFNIRDCLFDHCEDVIGGLGGKSSVEHSQFSECRGIIINVQTDNTVKIENCEFYNIVSDRRYGILEKSGIHFSISPESVGVFKEKLNWSYISNCTFAGIHQEKSEFHSGYYGKFGFISCALDKGLKVFAKGLNALQVKNCKFSHCMTDGNTEIIHEQNTGNETYVNESVVYTSNCSGLENVNKEGDRIEEIPIRHETSMGTPIGSRLDEASIGVPGAVSDFMPEGQ
jgi:hypothetical protein